MKKKRYILAFSLLCILSFKLNVFAVCDYETQVKLATEAANVNMTYEAGFFGTGTFVEAEIPDENGNYEIEIEEPKVKIYINNITENLKIEVLNKNTQERTIYSYDDSNNGTIYWERTNLDEIVEYEITIFPISSDCSDIELRKISKVTPKYNYINEKYFCDNNNSYYCQEFITSEINMSEEQIYKDAISKKEEEQEIQNQEQSFWEKNKKIILIITGIIGFIGVTTTAIIVIRRRSRVK